MDKFTFEGVNIRNVWEVILVIVLFEMTSGEVFRKKEGENTGE